MKRLIIPVGAAILGFTSVPKSDANDFRARVDVVYPAPPAHRQRVMLPSHIPYRDPGYRPMLRPMRTIYGPPLVLGLVPTHTPNAPVYNEPPPRFAQD